MSIVHFTPVYPEDLKEAQSKGYNCPMIKPILTFPFLWASSFVILIYSFTDSILQKMMAPFLIPSIIIAILCLVFIVYHSLKHTKSFFGFLRRLGIIFFLFFWIPVSVMAPQSEFIVSVLVDTTTSINAVDLQVLYPADKLEFLSFNDAQSIISFWQNRPAEEHRDFRRHRRGCCIWWRQFQRLFSGAEASQKKKGYI